MGPQMPAYRAKRAMGSQRKILSEGWAGILSVPKILLE